jgi:hypothetical protein
MIAARAPPLALSNGRAPLGRKMVAELPPKGVRPMSVAAGVAGGRDTDWGTLCLARV